MIKPGISAIEAGIRLAFLPCRNWNDFDRLHDDVAERAINSRSNPRQVPNHIKGWPDLIEYDHAPDHGGVFIVNSMANAYRYADLIVDTYNHQRQHPKDSDERAALCLSNPCLVAIDRQSRFTITSIVKWCEDQGYCLPPEMDDVTRTVFQGYLCQDTNEQFDYAFNLGVLLGRFEQELLTPKTSNKYNQQYLKSYIYGLTTIRSLFDNANVNGAELFIKPQTFYSTGQFSASSELYESPKPQVSHLAEPLLIEQPIVTNDNPVTYDIDGAIQLLADKTAQKLVQNGLNHPTKHNVAGDILNQKTVTKKFGELADYEYILRRFKVTWRNSLKTP